jgi:hypothetical protein
MATSLRKGNGVSRGTVQLQLPNSGNNGNGSSSFRDPAFGENKHLPVHRWVPWIAGFSAGFVDDVISTYIGPKSKETVLDPFCGVGTTLLQAILRGHKAIGFEINPYAALACRAKLTASRVDLAELDGAIALLESSCKGWKNGSAPSRVLPPPLKSRIPFLSPNVERQALHAVAFLNSLDSASLSDLCRLAFGAILVGISNYTYEPSLTSRPAAGKSLIMDADVAQVLIGKLRQMRSDIIWLRQEMNGKKPGKAEIINADFFQGQQSLKTGSIDLVVTSPPYMNNYHYVRNSRPHLYWLSFVTSPRQQRYLEVGNFGQYWQTVRDADPLSLVFHHPTSESIVEQLRAIRTEHGAYGGSGWANYVVAYLNDCYRFMGILRRVLRRGGTAVIVIGNSIIQGLNVQTQSILSEIGEMQGLKTSGVHCVREKRVGASITQSSVRRGAHTSAQLAEFAVIVRKK